MHADAHISSLGYQISRKTEWDLGTRLNTPIFSTKDSQDNLRIQPDATVFFCKHYFTGKFTEYYRSFCIPVYAPSFEYE